MTSRIGKSNLQKCTFIVITNYIESQSDESVETRKTVAVEIKRDDRKKFGETHTNYENVKMGPIPHPSEIRARVREPKPSGAKMHLPLAGSHQPLAYKQHITEGHRSRSREKIHQKDQGSAEECLQ